MSQIYNIYCDESCHLEHDGQSVMVLGAIWCPQEKAKDLNFAIRDIKTKHNLSRTFEIKWIKVSQGKQEFYLELVDFFFDNVDLHFRALIVPDKSKLDHKSYGQDHDTWYYKMYFDMLKAILEPDAHYHVYLDIKDTHSAERTTKLHEVLCNNFYDFQRQIIQNVQVVRSHEVELLQLADLLIGAISYVNRGLTSSSAKVTIIEKIRERSNYTLVQSNLLRENKLNLFIWQARSALHD